MPVTQGGEPGEKDEDDMVLIPLPSGWQQSLSGPIVTARPLTETLPAGSWVEVGGRGHRGRRRGRHGPGLNRLRSGLTAPTTSLNASASGGIFAEFRALGCPGCSASQPSTAMPGASTPPWRSSAGARVPDRPVLVCRSSPARSSRRSSTWRSTSRRHSSAARSRSSPGRGGDGRRRRPVRKRRVRRPDRHERGRARAGPHRARGPVRVEPWGAGCRVAYLWTFARLTAAALLVSGAARGLRRTRPPSRPLAIALGPTIGLLVVAVGVGRVCAAGRSRPQAAPP